MNELKKQLWWSRGSEYKLKKDHGNGTATFIHAPIMGKPSPHEFLERIDFIINTSCICHVCDKTHRIYAYEIIRTTLSTRNVPFKTISIDETHQAFYITRKKKKIIIMYFDKSFYINIVYENKRARKFRRFLEKNFDHTIIINHLEYKNLKKNLLRGLKEVWN